MLFELLLSWTIVYKQVMVQWLCYYVYQDFFNYIPNFITILS